ncbi:MAG: hypothetical protein OEZ34_05050, partial [Spirochaetia bacterium]|nr:hypothetical protein [Spirochaetia bacterium]
MNLLKKKTTTIIQTAFLAAGLYGVFAIAFPSSIQAQGKSCNSACSLYYDCFSIAFQYTDEGKTAQGKANLKKKKKSIINKCIKECSTKQS